MPDWITREQLLDVVNASDVSDEHAPDLIGCTREQWDGWIEGHEPCPHDVYQWLRIVCGQHPDFKPLPRESSGDPILFNLQTPEDVVRDLADALRRTIGGRISWAIGEGRSGTPASVFSRHLSVTFEVGGAGPKMYPVMRHVLAHDGERCVVEFWARRPGSGGFSVGRLVRA